MRSDVDVADMTTDELKRERRQLYKTACRQADYGNWNPTTRLNAIISELAHRSRNGDTND